jgi:ankyrin repeat/IBR domain-containing protein 1
LTFGGPSTIKQFHTAILEGEEEKAILLYTQQPDGSQVETKAVIVYQELPPNKPIPSKKNPHQETSLMFAVRAAMKKLVQVLLEHGGNPALQNTRKETCLHLLCSKEDEEELRATLLDALLEWEGISLETGEPMEKVSVNCVDIDGNLAIHYAAANGLLTCVERLVQLGSIISLVNRSNLTCCEMADGKGYKDLASMLELAIVFQPEEDAIDLTGFAMFGGNYHAVPSRLYLDTKSFANAGLDNLIEESIVQISIHLGWMNAKVYRSRAEALLHQYAWDVERLIADYTQNTEQVLSAAKMDSSYKSPSLLKQQQQQETGKLLCICM